METIVVSYEASNNRKQSMDPQALMSWFGVSAPLHRLDLDYRPIKPLESNFDLHKHE